MITIFLFYKDDQCVLFLPLHWCLIIINTGNYEFFWIKTQKWQVFFKIINHYHFLHFQQILSQLSVKSRKACSKISKKKPHITYIMKWLSSISLFLSKMNLNTRHSFLNSKLDTSILYTREFMNIWCQINNKKYWNFTNCINCHNQL